MKSRLNILYLSDSYRALPVYGSQVHSLCNEHAKYNNVNVLALTGHRDFNIRNYTDADYHLFKVLKIKANIPLVSRILAYFIALRFRRIFESADILHCRGHVGAYIGLHVIKCLHNRIPLIADIRGAIVDEFSRSPSIKVQNLAKYALSMERYVFNNIDNFFFVSESMRKYYNELYNLRGKNTLVFPTMVNTDIFNIDKISRYQKRSELKIPNDALVFIYSGSVSYWQKVDVILSAFKTACNNRDDLFLLVITQDTDAASGLAQAINCPDNKVKIVAADYGNVGKYLNSGDYGLLIRDDTITNKVACPVKLAEYLSCGLTVLTTIKYMDNPYIKMVNADAKSIAEAMSEMGNNTCTNNEIGSVMQSFDLKNIVGEQIQAYRSLLVT